MPKLLKTTGICVECFSKKKNIYIYCFRSPPSQKAFQVIETIVVVMTTIEVIVKLIVAGPNRRRYVQNPYFFIDILVIVQGSEAATPSGTAEPPVWDFPDLHNTGGFNCCFWGAPPKAATKPTDIA